MLPSSAFDPKRALKRTTDIISRKDIVHVIAIVLGNWYILVSIPLVVGVFSYLYTYRLADIYAAKCQILLKANDTYDYQNQIYKGLGFSSSYSSYEYTASQMRVIKSASLITKVLDKVPLDVSYYIVGRLKVTEVYKNVPFSVVTSQRTSNYSGREFNVTIIDTSSYFLTWERNGSAFKKRFLFGDLVLDDGFFFRIEKGANLNNVTIQPLSKISYMFTVQSRGASLSKYQRAIEVKNLDYTSIVEISLKDEIQSRAVEILDTLSAMYVANTLENKVQVNDNTLRYIDKQLDEVTDIINEIEKELETYKESSSVLNLTREEETYFMRLNEVETQIRLYETQVAALDDLTDYLLKDEGEDFILPPNLFVANADPDLGRMIKELYDLREQYDQSLNTITKQNQKAENVLNEIGELKQRIIRYIQVQRTELLEDVAEHNKEVAEIESRIKNIPKTQRQILNIERRLQVNEALYSFLLSKRAETVIARAAIIPETKVIEKARGVGVVYPDKERMNLTAILIAFGFAIVIVVLKELFFQKVRSLGQLQSITDLSILGSIQKVKDFSKTFRIRSGRERSDLAQAFRMLRTNLQYFVSGDDPKVILVTSLLPGEGKTFTSVNLASILAIAEKKVLIMDFDLHKPRLAKAMELANETGVSSVLIGTSSFDDSVQHTDIPTLDVLTSGPVPPNASELIFRKELDVLIAQARENYDYVFIDTPPVSLISDGLILMKEVDVKLFVLNSKSTSKTSIDYIESIVETNKLENCGLILNEERASRIDYYYSRYGYGGYGYGGYGYGYGGGPSEYGNSNEGT